MRISCSSCLAALTLAVLLLQLPGHSQSMCNAVSNNPLVMQTLCSQLPQAQAVPATLHTSLSKQPPEVQPITAEAINHMRLVDAPPIGNGDVLRYEANRSDFILELFFGNGKEIVIEPLTEADAENIEVRWKQGETKLDYPETMNQHIVHMRIRVLHQLDAPLLLRGVKITRNGQILVQLQVTYTGPTQLPFEPPTSYPPDPMTPNAHIANVSVSRADLLGHQPQTGFLAPKLPSYSMNPMMFQSTTTNTSDPNHYKFQGKELDAETGLYNFGARYYNPALSRFMSPDWSAKPAAVPFADLSNPQTLNLYTFGRNNPTSLGDSDGHCVGDDCSDVKVEVKVIQQPKIVQGEKQPDGSFRTGVRATVQDTITAKDKPLIHTKVDESNTYKATLNGQSKDLGHQVGPSETNNAGQVNDTVGLLAPAGTPQEDAPLVDLLKTGAVTYTNDNTITFTTPGGETCSCTTTRTITNVGADGKGSQNYTIDPGKPVVKPAQQPQPKDKPQQ